MRDEQDVLARARVLYLARCLAEGTPVALLRQELQRHALGIHLTAREATWFWEDADVDADLDRMHEAIDSLAWILGITGAIEDALDEGSVSMRAERELRDATSTPAICWALGEHVDWS